MAAAVKRVVDKIGKCESLLRYQVRDEPPTEMVGNWLLVQRVLAAVDPRHPAFSCFCHHDSLDRITASPTMAETVFDIYLLREKTPLQSLGGFLSSLDTFKTASKGNAMWAVLQAFAITHEPGSWRYPTAEELRAMTYLSLAAGVKGVFYFIYSHMPKYLDGMVSADGKAQPIYAPTSALAQELQTLAPLLLSLKLAGVPPKVEGDARVGSFKDAAGRAVLIVASARPDAETTARVAVAGEWQDALTSERFKSESGTLSVQLAPSGARVLVGR